MSSDLLATALLDALGYVHATYIEGAVPGFPDLHEDEVAAFERGYRVLLLAVDDDRVAVEEDGSGLSVAGSNLDQLSLRIHLLYLGFQLPLLLAAARQPGTTQDITEEPTTAGGGGNDEGEDSDRGQNL
ncbi:MAG TPA: hypothetical protein VFI91_11525 [Longimicrobiaceae bacterium]|nr:hypothetical protein [Longimicrobiaceae bacterium]